MAAPKIALPEWVFNLPISFKVSTVMLTEVAVSITPINAFWSTTLHEASESITPGLLKKYATANPPIIGMITPQSAITNAAFPLFFSSLISVSSPAQNISTITPSSATLLKNSVSVSSPSIDGPNKRPASNEPTTCGICTRFVASPNTFVQSSITAKSSKNL